MRALMRDTAEGLITAIISASNRARDSISCSREAGVTNRSSLVISHVSTIITAAFSKAK
jgi:hypothetical protein